MALRCIMRGPPARPQWWGTRSWWSAGGPATPRSWSRPRRFTTAPAGTTPPPIPVPGDHVAAASDGTYLYAVGGAKLTSAINTAAVQRFNPATGQWTQLTHLQTAANAVGAAVVDGQLITFGGSNLGTVFNTVRAYNLTTKTWSSLPHMPQARQGMGVAVIGNDIYAIDGAAQPGHTHPPAPSKSSPCPHHPFSWLGCGGCCVARCSRLRWCLRRWWVAGSGWPVG